MIMVLCVAGLLAVLIPAVRQAREAARASQCICNLCQIKLALQNYHSTYGSFPPAYVADATGKPMHSWRVLILPFLEQDSLYNAYSMAEPWDGPEQQEVARPAAEQLQLPEPGRWADSDELRRDHRTGDGLPRRQSDQARRHPRRSWPDDPGCRDLKRQHRLDRARDLDVTTMSWVIDDPSRPGISSPHPSGPAVVFADATYRRLSTYHPPKDLKAMTTIDGGEPVDDMEKPH